MTESDLFGDSVYECRRRGRRHRRPGPVEALTGDDPDEATQTGYSPPDREPYNLRHAPTPLEEFEGESLDERLAEEEPDISPDDADTADAPPRAGRLVAPDEGVHADEESEEIATDVGRAGYAFSSEEAAVHVVDEDTAFEDENIDDDLDEARIDPNSLD